MNWDELAEWIQRPATFEYAMEQRRKVEAALAVRKQAEVVAAATSDASPTPAAAPDVVAAPKAPADPVAALETALDATAGEPERAALLAAAPREVREQLAARLTYRKLHRDTDAAIAAEHRECAEFSARLEVAANDQERLAIIRGAARALVARWRDHETDTEDAARRRYLAMVARDGVDAA